MRTFNSSTALVMGLVFAIAFGAGCAEGEKTGKKHAGAVVTATGDKVMDYTTEVKSGPTKVTFTFAASMFTKEAAVAAQIVSWDAEVDGNTTTRVKTTALPGGGRQLVLTTTDGSHETFIVPIGADGKVVADVNKKGVSSDFSAWSQTEGSFPVDQTRGGFRWFLLKGRVVPSPMRATVTKKTTGGYEQNISVLAELFPEVRNPGTGKWNWEVNKVATSRFEAAAATKDGWREVTLTLPQLENSTLRAVFVEGGNILQQDGKDLVMDFSVWSSGSYPVNVADGTILLRADRGDLTKWGTREVPGRPGTDGYGSTRFGVELLANVPLFHLYLQLPVLTDVEQKDGQKILVGADWDKFPAEVTPISWYPGWYEPIGIMGKPKWDTALEFEVVVASSSGSRKRTFEWQEESEYLRPGSKSAVQFTVSGKAYVAPVSTLETGAMLAEYAVSQGPLVALRVPNYGSGKTQYRVLGKFTTPKGDVRVDVTLHPDFTWQEVVRDTQGNANPVTAGQEKLTVSRGTTILTVEARSGVNVATGELQGIFTYPPPVAPATNQVPPLKKEFGFWVTP